MRPLCSVKRSWEFLQVSEKISSDMDSSGSPGSSKIANITSSEDSDDDLDSSIKSLNELVKFMCANNIQDLSDDGDDRVQFERSEFLGAARRFPTSFE